MAAPSISEALDALILCVTEALTTAERPVCDSGTTIGAPQIGPGTCCDECGCETCGDNAGGRVMGSFLRVYPADGATLQPVVRMENCNPGYTAAEFNIVVMRCFPTMDSLGRMPTVEETTEAADNLHKDVSTTWKALQCCGQKILIREGTVDPDPDGLGGCSAFAVRVTVPVTL